MAEDSFEVLSDMRVERCRVGPVVEHEQVQRLFRVDQHEIAAPCGLRHVNEPRIKFVEKVGALSSG